MSYSPFSLGLVYPVASMAWTFGLGIVVGVLVAIPLSIAVVRHEAIRIRRLEKRARSAERLAELGTLTGGLAHEIKNPLSTIGLNIQLLQEDLNGLALQEPGDDSFRDQIGRTRRRFEALSRETQRLRETLDDFLRFAGRVKLDCQPTDINALVSELADFFEPQAQAAGVRFRVEATPRALMINADTSLLKQAVLNLLINAVQVIAESRYRDQTHGGDELILRIHKAKMPGQEEVQIHVIDTGPGIDADNLGKVFQPYYSSKKRGTGLGLPTARRIVEEHGGTLTVHSELGRGTDFVIALPTQKNA